MIDREAYHDNVQFPEGTPIQMDGDARRKIKIKALRDQCGWGSSLNLPLKETMIKQASQQFL